MWNRYTLTEYEELVKDLLKKADVQIMDTISQHGGGVSCLDHCIFVSYISYTVCRHLGLDAVSAARAGLLHDLYLCDWSKTDVGPWERLIVHPRMALENAEAYGLNDLERDIILKHMWPLTITQFPRHLESMVVSLADKFCATAEMLRLYSVIGARRHLARLNFCKERLRLRLAPSRN